MNRTAHFLALQFLIPITLWMSIADLNSAVASLDLSQHDRVDRVMTSVGNVTGKMGTAVEPILWGGGLAIVGLVVFAIAITRFRYRRPWAFWFSCIYGGPGVGIPNRHAIWAVPTHLCADAADRVWAASIPTGSPAAGRGAGAFALGCEASTRNPKTRSGGNG